MDLVLDPPKPTLVTYSALMSRAVSLGKPRVALHLWNLMCSQQNFYTRVQHANGDVIVDDDVLILDVIFCNTLMNAYAKLGDHESARLILNAMVEVVDGTEHDGIPPTQPTVVTYNMLMDACKVMGELGEALEVLDLMTLCADVTGDVSLLPDAWTYTILISNMARKSRRGGGVAMVLPPLIKTCNPEGRKIQTRHSCFYIR
ncbi:hypothetical protein ACHAXA_008389 [Cyclostephanos tholiformis]|uniref:Pentatricopeptide repeat-containing protein n=1 Tax=Cyclostephanos tholiformis TaxID=382380 RepID=A0ABD3RVS8_9STRA